MFSMDKQSTVDPEIIDCGWPPLRFLKQVKEIEEAYNELRTIGADVLASADEHPDTATQNCTVDLPNNE